MARTLARVTSLFSGVVGGKANWRTNSHCRFIWGLLRRISGYNFFGVGVEEGAGDLEEAVVAYEGATKCLIAGTSRALGPTGS